MREGPPIPFFTDQNVADSAGNFLREWGHELTRLRDCMAVDTKDPLVALACAEGGHVLVSHDNDFPGVARRLQLSQRAARTRLHRIGLRCFEPDAAQRLRAAIRLIEMEWALALAEDRAMVVEIHDRSIRLLR